MKYVPNVSGSHTGAQPHFWECEPVVVGIGRVARQKDPVWFAQVALELKSRFPRCTLKWLGGGDAELERQLTAAGVEVSGWIPRETLMAELGKATFYVHTASWEGAPLSVTEAAALGIPVIGRDTPALRSLDLPYLCGTPTEVADLATGAIRNSAVAEMSEVMREWSSQYTPKDQGDMLYDAYNCVRHGVA